VQGYFRFHTQGETLLDPGTGLPYEVATSYASGDLFDIHYVQSADVLTLVHPNYPPAELRRLGATNWTLTNIVFTPSIAAPTSVAVAASPGYKSKISSMSSASPAIITTVANHALVLGDGIYVQGETGLTDGFYQVTNIPKDGTGAPILNELSIGDYDGNSIGGGTYSGSGTIQYGTKVFNIDIHYAVTAIATNGVDESALSTDCHVVNNLDVTGSYNTITWAAVTGASRYRIYEKRNGLWGFIGETTELTFTDDNIAPDMGLTPPTYDTVFAGVGDYPGSVSYFEQRRCFAGTLNQPQNVWMTKSGTESNMSYSLPTTDSDRIAFRVAAREANTIRHIMPLTQLLLLTSSAEVRVSPVNADAITPTSISVRPQSFVGTNNVPPSIINNSIVCCAARGGHVREIGYSWQANGFVTGDLSLRAAHLFDNLSILDQCFVKAPRQIVWFVSSSGKLLGLTYVPEEQVGAWHEHDTDGTFESITRSGRGPGR
jgi:hypothetical protein